MFETFVPLQDFPLGVDAGGFHAEIDAERELPRLLAVSVGADVRVVFGRRLTPVELDALIVLVENHDPAAAELKNAKANYRASADLRLADLQDFRRAATMSAAELDAEAAAVKQQVSAAPDEPTARAIAEQYTRTKL